MKKMILFTVFVFSLVLFIVMTSCTSKQNSQKIDDSLPPSLQKYQEDVSVKQIPENLLKTGKIHKVDLKIEDMTCPSCALGVEYQLKQLDGVFDAKVEYPKGTAFAIYDATKLTAQKIAEASTAYPATIIKDEVMN